MTTTDKSPVNLEDKHVELIGKLVCDIRNGKLDNSVAQAQATVSVVYQIVNECNNPTAFGLIGVLRSVGRQLVSQAPHALVAANMVRRVLRAVRDEQRVNQSGETAGESLQRLVLVSSARRGTLPTAQHDLRSNVLDHMAELESEIEGSESAVVSAAGPLVRGALVVMIPHPLCERVASKAGSVIITGGQNGAETAARLATNNRQVLLTGIESACAITRRARCVLIGVCGALAGGALLAPAGTLQLARAAKLYNVPVFALAPLSHLTPLHATDPQQIPLDDPSGFHAYGDAHTEFTHTYAPMYDYIIPDLVSLYITNLGGNSPSYIYRLLSELYDPLDSVF